MAGAAPQTLQRRHAAERAPRTHRGNRQMAQFSRTPTGTDKGPACVETSGEDETDSRNSSPELPTETDGDVGAYWMASPEAPVGTDAGSEGAETPD